MLTTGVVGLQVQRPPAAKDGSAALEGPMERGVVTHIGFPSQGTTQEPASMELLVMRENTGVLEWWPLDRSFKPGEQGKPIAGRPVYAIDPPELEDEVSLA